MTFSQIQGAVFVASAVITFLLASNELGQYPLLLLGLGAVNIGLHAWALRYDPAGAKQDPTAP